MTALSILGTGFRQAATGGGMVGSIARWTVMGSILSSLPNPAARKQAIDKALYDANREAERHYMSQREDMKREAQIAKREREFSYTQRIADARFLANPEERNFERRMAEIDRKYSEVFQKIEETSLERQKGLEEANRIMDSRRNTQFWDRTSEDWSNWGNRWHNTGVNAQQGVAKFVDLITNGVTLGHGTNFAGTEADWDKKRAGQTLTSRIPEEWMRQFGDQLNHRFELANGSFGEFRNGQRLINAKTEEDQVAILRELNRHVEKIGEQQRHAEQVQAREQQAAEARHTRMVNAIEQSAKERQLGYMNIQTDSVIQKAQLDAVIASPFASAEQKMMARVEKGALAKQTITDHHFNLKRNEMVKTGEKTTDIEGIKQLQESHKKQEDEELQAAREKYNQSRQAKIDAELNEYMWGKDGEAGEWQQQKSEAMKKATTHGLLGRAAQPYGGDPAEVHKVFTRKLDKKRKELEQKYDTDFARSDEYREYQEQSTQRKDTLDKAIVSKTNQDEYRRRGEIDGAAIDRQHQLATAANRMDAEHRKMAISAAMQSTVRSGLEDSYRMVSDELMRTGEAQRLGGSLGGEGEFGKAVNEHLKPVLEDMAKQYQKLENVLISGKVEVTVRNPPLPRWQ